MNYPKVFQKTCSTLPMVILLIYKEVDSLIISIVIILLRFWINALYRSNRLNICQHLFDGKCDPINIYLLHL